MKENSRAKKLRVGVVGTGYLGGFHAEKYSQIEDVKLVGVADIDISKARESAKKTFCKAYSNHKDLIKKVDAVSIAAPTTAHFDIARDFIENRVHVLIEKPITTKLSDADMLIRLAKDNGCIIQVGHIERFNPAAEGLNILRPRPYLIEARRLAKYQLRGTDVSVVLDLMIHDIDIALNIMKSKIVSINAAGAVLISKHIDFASTLIKFENGFSASLTASRISSFNSRKIRLLNNHACISLDFANHEMRIVKRGINEPEIEKKIFKKRDALAHEIESFVDAVINLKAPVVTGQTGRNALKVALDIESNIKALL